MRSQPSQPVEDDLMPPPKRLPRPIEEKLMRRRAEETRAAAETTAVAGGGADSPGDLMDRFLAEVDAVGVAGGRGGEASPPSAAADAETFAAQPPPAAVHSPAPLQSDPPATTAAAALTDLGGAADVDGRPAPSGEAEGEREFPEVAEGDAMEAKVAGLQRQICLIAELCPPSWTPPGHRPAAEETAAAQSGSRPASAATPASLVASVGERLAEIVAMAEDSEGRHRRAAHALRAWACAVAARVLLCADENLQPSDPGRREVLRACEESVAIVLTGVRCILNGQRRSADSAEALMGALRQSVGLGGSVNEGGGAAVARVLSEVVEAIVQPCGGPT